MPRSGWKKPQSKTRLSDLVSVGLLTRVFPPDLVDEVIAAAGRTERRRRALPARSMAYFAIGMALHSQGSYEDVMAQLTDGLSWSTGWEGAYVPPSKSGIFQARERLGAEPVEALFRRVAHPLAGLETPGSWLEGRRLVAIDGTCLDVADTAVNDEHFGRAGVSRGERAAFPQARVVALIECGTHVIFDAEVGPYTTSEVALAGPLLDRLEPGMVVLADRGFGGFALWARAAATGADLLWRFKDSSTGLRPHLLRDLPDGSWLALIDPPKAMRNKVESLTVRVVDYTIDDGRESDATYRLFTTLLDPEEATAQELALAYAQRWEIESVFDELKTHQRGPKMVLRSKSPALVLQEIWGYLCCHYAIRTLMAETAATGGRDPDQVSFVAALRIARRSIAHQGDFSPSRP
ncbi:MAG: IS4 family transposase [Cryobacterium sp.]|nr:IS4 family transposase [Cryobacterium sp.]